jgi:colanic acid/amylovoran biosynthesis glycosyltransferase
VTGETVGDTEAGRGPRVVYVVSLFPCWSETFIVRELRALLRRGVDVQILSLRYPCEALVQGDARALQGRVHYPPSGWRAVSRVVRALRAAPRRQARVIARRLFAFAGSPVALAKTLVAGWRSLALAETVRGFAPDHIHAHWATYPTTAALLLSEILDVPFSFTCHAHDIYLEEPLLPEKLRASRFAVTISEFNRALLSERAGPAASARIEVIRCGVPLEQFPYRPEGREPGTLLAVGRLDPIKGFAHLLEACAILRDRGRDIRCDIIGDGPLRHDLEARVDRLRLRDRVRLRGALPQEELRRFLYRASAFVLPSVVTPEGNRDGIPVALMEAMAAGLPVVSTGVSGIPEIVESGENGLLVPPGEPAPLADALASLLDDPARRVRFAARGRETVERRFDVEQEAERLLACFVREAIPAAPLAPAPLVEVVS